MRKFLGRPWWQGVAAIIGAFGLVAAILALLPDDEPAPAQISVGSGNNSIVGDNNQCNAVGDGVELNCVLPTEPVTFGDVSVAWPYASYYVFAGRAAALPTPPPFGPEDRAGHCDEWADWLASTKDLYAIGPLVTVGMTSSETEVVAITRIEAKVFDRKPLPRDFVVMRCQFGAGGESGFMAIVDTRTLRTQVDDFGSGKTFALPPGSLFLSGQDYGSGEITFRSDAKYLYEGALTVVVKINGAEKKITLGSPARPIRWVDRAADTEVTPWRPEEEYGWSPERKRWIKGHLPFSQ